MSRGEEYYSRTKKVDIMSIFDWNSEETNLGSIILIF
jgi:hypothetical protein